MMRLLRLVLFVGLAFVGGIMFERAHQADTCEKSGGEWMRAGFCAAENG